MTEKELRFKKKIMTDGRKTGILLILIGIGLPLILSFIQDNGEFRFYNSSLGKNIFKSSLCRDSF